MRPRGRCRRMPITMMLHTRQRGFTLIEMIVSVALFAVVMLVSVGALLSLVDANRKAQGLQSVMNNLNVAVDGMVRAIRMGSNYHCGSTGTYSVAADCSNLTTGDTFLAFEPYHDCSDPDTTCDANGNVAPWLYWYAKDGNGVGRLYKSEDGTIASGVPITSSDVSIETVTFYVIGTSRSDTIQPKVVIVVKGTTGNKAKTSTTFHVQATAVQRILDI